MRGMLKKIYKKPRKNKKNVLAVGAHPDDIELGCGGALRKHLLAGDEVYVIIMTNGERGDHPDSRIECLNSLKSLGIKSSNIRFGNFRDADLKEGFEVVSYIEGYIKKFNIDRVFTHTPYDRHQDHRSCSNAVAGAARRISEILFFQGPSTTVEFQPHYYIGLNEDHMKTKIRCLNFYKSQIRKGIVDLRWVRNLAETNSFGMNEVYSEAFGLNHIFRDGDQL